MTTPHRDELESLRQRRDVLRRENAELETQVRARPVQRRRTNWGIVVFVLACLALPCLFICLQPGCARLTFDTVGSLIP